MSENMKCLVKTHDEYCNIISKTEINGNIEQKATDMQSEAMDKVIAMLADDKKYILHHDFVPNLEHDCFDCELEPNCEPGSNLELECLRTPISSGFRFEEPSSPPIAKNDIWTYIAKNSKGWYDTEVWIDEDETYLRIDVEFAEGINYFYLAL